MNGIEVVVVVFNRGRELKFCVLSIPMSCPIMPLFIYPPRLDKNNT